MVVHIVNVYQCLFRHIVNVRIVQGDILGYPHFPLMCEEHFTGVFKFHAYFYENTTYRPVRHTNQDGRIETFICMGLSTLAVAGFPQNSFNIEHVGFAGSTVIFKMADSQQKSRDRWRSVIVRTGVRRT